MESLSLMNSIRKSPPLPCLSAFELDRVERLAHRGADAALFEHFAVSGLDGCFTGLDASLWQHPRPRFGVGRNDEVTEGRTVAPDNHAAGMCRRRARTAAEFSIGQRSHAGFDASIAIRPGRLAASAPTILTEDGRPCLAITVSAPERPRSSQRGEASSDDRFS